MRRSICTCEPNIAEAGEVRTWSFHYTPSTNLAKNSKVKFDLGSFGREIDWEVPEVADVSKKTSLKNAIWAEYSDGSRLKPKEIEVADQIVPHYEFTLSKELKAGETLTIMLGGKKGIRAQTYAQRRRLFNLHVSSKGGQFEDTQTFHMDIRGAELSFIRLLTPAYVSRNKRFDVTIRYEDAYGNLTNVAPEDTLIELSYENLRDNLNWKLFVPETGFVTLPNLYFNEAGVYRIQLKNLNTKECYFSSPIKCFDEDCPQLFWGLLHGESEKVDSNENIDAALRHFRDEQAMNFFATSSFEDAEETPPDVWKAVSQTTADFNEEDRFITYLGFQWSGDAKTEGLHQLIYSKDMRPLLRKKDSKSSSLKKVFKAAPPKEMIAIPCFTMASGHEYDFSEFSPEIERVVEIYNSWGSSECSEKEGNPLPIQCAGKKGIKESPCGSIQGALAQNRRFGFVAGGLDDRGVYADLFESDQEQYPPGMTAIIAKEHSKESIFESLYKRSCYATTGERILLGFYLAGQPMGSELSLKQKPGLAINRHLSGFVAGTNKVTSIEIIRNGEVIKKFEPNQDSYEFEFDDMDDLNKNHLKAPALEPHNSDCFSYYYLRAQQEDGHIAWSSPIWVDLLPSK